MSEVARSPDEALGRPLRIGFFGATLDTGNLGVSALALGSLQGLIGTGIPIDLTLFDERPGNRSRQIEGEGWKIDVALTGCYVSRRFYSVNNLQQCYWAAQAGLGKLHPTLARIKAMDAIVDVSGGDSFCDLYGELRFKAITYPKLITLKLGVPLILLPQTYGPFSEGGHKEIARRILARARQAWARDQRGLSYLQELLGASFRPTQHRACVDVAFGLQVKEPADAKLREAITAFKSGARVLLGLNVSGLLFANAEDSQKIFGFRDPYRDIMRKLLRGLLDLPDARVLLISHVNPLRYKEGADVGACEALHAEFASEDDSRVMVAPHIDDPCQVKWVIGQCDWFSGARMHSCIGALSQGIPTVAFAYSDKTLGVAETAGAGKWVVDPRRESSGELVARAVESVGQLEEMKASIESALGPLRGVLQQQFRQIAESIRDVVLRGTSA